MCTITTVSKKSKNKRLNKFYAMEIPSVDRDILFSFLDSLEKAGIDIDAACRAEGLVNPRDIEGQRIPIAHTSPVFDAMAKYTGDEEYIYHMALNYNPDQVGTLFYLIKFCQTVYDAIRMICRYSSIASDVITFTFAKTPAYCDVRFTPNPRVYISLHQLEGIMYMATTQYQRVAPQQKNGIVEKIFFQHQPRFPIARYEHYYNCPVVFGHAYSGIRMSAKVLDLPMLAADQRMAAYFKTVAERYEVDMGAEDGIIPRIQRLFIHRMAFGETDLRDVARALSVSVRSLQRQLKAEGTSYRQVTESARLSVAKQELRSSGRALNDVAILLGYSDERAFRRAFQRVTGITPAEYRDGREPLASE